MSKSPVPATGATNRLTAYPSGLAGAPDVRSVSFTVAPGGATLAPFTVPDAQPLDGAAVVPAAAAAGEASVPGGDASIPDVLRSAPTTPIIGLLALFAAGILGAGHALTPGHGKTLMAAYLVGTRGTPRHAVGLGLAVSVSHTLGILALAALVLAAETRLPPDMVVRIAPLVAAVSILVVGGWMLFTEARRAIAARRSRRQELDHEAAHAHGADHAHDHDHAHAPDHEHGASGAHAHDHDEVAVANPELEHSHGGVRHTHLPPAGSTISWRSLFVLGLAGGLVPSASALLILLATIAAGRPGVGRDPGRGVRPRDGGGHDRRRARVRARPGPDRARAVADPHRGLRPPRPGRGRGPRPGPRPRAHVPGAVGRDAGLTVARSLTASARSTYRRTVMHVTEISSPA